MHYAAAVTRQVVCGHGWITNDKFNHRANGDQIGQLIDVSPYDSI